MLLDANGANVEGILLCGVSRVGRQHDLLLSFYKFTNFNGLWDLYNFFGFGDVVEIPIYSNIMN